ncbi:hypothetical protein GCM10027419_18170 [Pandoraea terrae]
MTAMPPMSVISRASTAKPRSRRAPCAVSPESLAGRETGNERDGNAEDGDDGERCFKDIPNGKDENGTDMPACAGTRTPRTTQQVH